MSVMLECLGTEDGDPWGVYAYGHIDPALVTLDAINAELDRAGFEPVDSADVRHLWMVSDDMGDEDANEEYPWNWCAPDVPGAIAVTGVKF
jgi:hypothetical protein